MLLITGIPKWQQSEWAVHGPVSMESAGNFRIKW